MLTSIRSLSAATLSAGILLSSVPALANENSSETAGETASGEVSSETASSDVVTVIDSSLTKASEPIDIDKVSYADDGPGFSVSGNVALVSEYRFRGVDLSGGELAIQGGVDFATDSGIYLGTWASSLDEDTVGFGSTEVDVYGGWSGNLTDAISADVGVIAYLYPDAGPGDFDYVEFYGSAGFTLGPVETTVGVAYAPDQASLGDTDNFYIYGDIGIGVPGTPLTVTGHLGYTDGFLTFTDDSKAFDWSIGAEAAVYGPVSIGVAYVGVEGDGLIDPGGVFTDDAIVLTLSASI